jgi:hypothetical protein
MNQHDQSVHKIGAKSGYYTFIKLEIAPSYAIITKQRMDHERKSKIQSMQTLSSQPPNHISQQTRKIAVFAILLFALAGLISGFAVGAFVHSKAKTGTGAGTAPNTGSVTTPNTKVTHTTVSTTTAEHVNLDLPVINQGDYSYFQIANGSTNYTFSSQIINKDKNPTQAPDVTCKLWLTKEGDVNSILRADQYSLLRTIDNIQQPFPKEVVGAFNYIAPSQQTQPCAPTGKTSWSYTISQSVDPGTYNLVVLADWKGKSFNWSWVSIEIKKAG